MRILLFGEGKMFLPEVAHSDGNEGDEHLGWRGVPTENFHAEFEAEIVDCQVDENDEDIAA